LNATHDLEKLGGQNHLSRSVEELARELPLEGLPAPFVLLKHSLVHAALVSLIEAIASWLRRPLMAAAQKMKKIVKTASHHVARFAGHFVVAGLVSTDDQEPKLI
jgi:hypothetical protein